MSTAAPVGFRLAPSTRVLDGGGTLLVGGGGVLRLAPAAAAVVAAAPTTCHTPTECEVARRLVARDAAVPWWPEPAPADDEVDDITVVVPVRDRADGLARLLAALPSSVPVVVVDDGSEDPGATRHVAAIHGARCVVLGRNEGPAAARNRGLRLVGTPYVAFCDSDVTPEEGWLGTLRRHLDDADVAVVAPRVLGSPPRREEGWIDRYEAARSSLDLGPWPATVRVRGRVGYVPAACLVARVAALGDGFDAALRSGEDVDLVWRLLDAGWQVRYDPAATVRHEHRSTLVPWLARKTFYGTSAAPLAARHGAAVAPAVWTPWSLVLAVAVLAQRRWSLPVAAGTAAVTTGALARRLGRGRGGGPAWRPAAHLAAEGAVATLWQTASCLTRHHWPVAVLGCLISSRVRRAVAVAGVLEGLADHHRVGPELDPLRYVLARRLDDAAYGAGVWAGAWRARSPRALLPVWVRAAARPDAAAPPGR